MRWNVQKFGGSSLANHDCFKNVAQIILESNKNKSAVVVSAMKGITDSLIELVNLSLNQNQLYKEKLDSIYNTHTICIKKLIPKESQNKLIKIIQNDIKTIQDLLKSIWLLKNSSTQALEYISGFGEIWSAQILNLYLNSLNHKSVYLDARNVLIVEPHTFHVDIDWKASQKRANDFFSKKEHANCVIITGFIASTKSGTATTLKRNGSDFSAAIFAHLLKADLLTIWSDVDGILTADPKLVNDAKPLDEISYHEVAELAYFGAKVLHPASITPVLKLNIPILMKNSFNKEFKGTLISNKSKSSNLISGITTIPQMALFNIEGNGMSGVPGLAQKLFLVLKNNNISVVLISQASSEHSICFTIPQNQAKVAKNAIEKEFAYEIDNQIIQSINFENDCSILAIVGDNMVSRTGIAGKLFSSLGNAKINIKAIAQGSSERNISVVISSNESVKALNAVHSSFYLSPHTISLGLIGNGLIGTTFLNQLESKIEELKTQKNIDIRINGIINSSKMWLTTNNKRIEKKSDLNEFIKHVKLTNVPHTILIDATASEVIPQKYPEWLENGIHIITPNKKANSSNYSFYQKLKQISFLNNSHYLYSTNVGAGLPILKTLKNLYQTGDTILKIEGVLSGTLSYIFNNLSTEKNFDEVLYKAMELGLTEPDPRDDLSGLDVARKLIILAREINIKLELKDVEIESLLPAEFKKLSKEEFFKNVKKLNSHFKNKLRDKHNLRYVAELENNKAKISLKHYPFNHSMSSLHHSDNIVIFTTERYKTQPLTIVGPGAGPNVTAAGVFSDLLNLIGQLGANL